MTSIITSITSLGHSHHGRYNIHLQLKKIMYREGLSEMTLLYAQVHTKWISSVFSFYISSTQHFLLILFCSICCVEGSVKANLSGGGELASGAVMVGPPGSLHCLARLLSPLCWEYGRLREICLSEAHWWDMCSAAPLMRTQVVQCYFCWRLLYFITEQSTASRQRGGAGGALVTMARAKWARVTGAQRAYITFAKYIQWCWRKWLLWVQWPQLIWIQDQGERI